MSGIFKATITIILMETSSTFKAGWNLAEPMIYDIANRLRCARDNLLRGNLETYYWNLETIMRMMYGFISDEDRKEVLKQELEIQKRIPLTIKNKSEFSMLVKKYDGLVMVILHKYKFLMPPKVDKTRLIG